MFYYNNQQDHLILKEYGRNIQKLVEYIKTIDDKDKRTQYAFTLIELMKQINPSVRENNETNQKLWDDLYIMSNFDLEVDSPQPMPEKSILGRKPQRVPYNANITRHKHYGHNIELLIKKTIDIEDPEEKKNAIIYIGRLMKTFYSTYNKDNINDAVIVENLREMSDNKLIIDLEEVKEKNLFDVSNHKNRSMASKQPYQSSSPGKLNPKHGRDKSRGRNIKGGKKRKS